MRKAHLHNIVRIERVGRPSEAAESCSGDPRGPKISLGFELGSAVYKLEAVEVLAEAHLHIMVKSWQNQACDMTIGKARLDIVGAEPIGSELAFAVWKL